MATGNIGVDIAVIESTATDIRTENSTMKTNLTEISDGVNNLKTAWQSEAADQLSTISTKMTSRFQDLEKAVESFAQFLDGVASNYNKTEAAAVASQQSVANLFNE